MKATDEINNLTIEELKHFAILLNVCLNCLTNEETTDEQRDGANNTIDFLNEHIIIDINSLPTNEKILAIEEIKDMSTNDFNRKYVEQMLKERGIA